MKAWHFLKDDMTAGSGLEPAWSEGEERTIKGRKEIILCEYGYHSSPSPWCALAYAPGSMLCLVEISEPEGRDETKYVSRTRRIVKAINIEQQLREFACEVAEEALNLEVQRGNTVDERSRAAIEVARRFARGDASRAALEAARAAAWAAWAAARAAARAAAWAASDAASDAAWAAAWAAARAAARDAASDAAWNAAWAAARDAAGRKFNALVEPLFADVVA